MKYRMATLADLEFVWDKDIAKNNNSECWKKWKQDYIHYNETGMAKTFVAVDGNNVIAQITVVIDQNVGAVKDKSFLCNKDTINMNAFRCDKEYEGQGHISKLVKMGEEYARNLGKKYATIGAEATIPRNLSIYFHFGYLEFLKAVIEEDDGQKELVLYYRKKL